jgi:hypothetical protein
MKLEFINEGTFQEYDYNQENGQTMKNVNGNK